MEHCCENLVALPSKITQHLRNQLGDTKLLVHLLVIVFAISSWADINGMWVELPLLVLDAPEGWTLPSYITIISQIANIGPLLFVILTVLAPRAKPSLEKWTSVVIIIIGVAAALLLAFFWSQTSYIGGVNHSTALLVLNFFLALGDCTSSVSFYAFMSLLKPQYMPSLFIGEGLSGMLPALIALGQGVSEINCVNKSTTANHTFPNGTEYNTTTYSVVAEFGSPAFSVEVFFFTLAAILSLSAIAFILLNTLPYCQSEMVEPNSFEYENIVSNSDSTRHYGSQDPQKDDDLDECSLREQADTIFKRAPEMNIYKFIAFLVIVVIINMTLTSFLGTIQVYSTLPYGLEPYHLTTTLTAIANPLACLFAVVYLTRSLAAITGITLFGSLGVVYIVYLAAMSPTPPLHGQEAGAISSVGVWILVTLLMIYAKVCVGGVMRQHGRNALIWAGVATQIGSLVGALVGFVLVQEYKLFVSAPYC